MENSEDKRDCYFNELEKWNSSINLVSPGDMPFLLERHWNDSIQVVSKIPDNSRIADIGSGNGFPVIPLSIEKKDSFFTAIESREKRVVFLKNVTRKLAIQNLDICWNRVEELYKDMNSKFDIIISRAFKDIINFVEIAHPLLKKGGKVIAFNSISNQEIEAIEQRTKRSISNVDNFVYKLKDKKSRTISSFHLL